MGYEPFYLLYGRSLIYPIETKFIISQKWPGSEKELQKQLLQHIERILKSLVEACQEAKKKINKAQVKQKEQYEKRNKIESYEISN